MYSLPPTTHHCYQKSLLLSSPPIISWHRRRLKVVDHDSHTATAINKQGRSYMCHCNVTQQRCAKQHTGNPNAHKARAYLAHQPTSTSPS